jgi:hypothetical protein
VSRTAKGQHSVPLELAPNFNALTGAPRWKTEDEQKPWPRYIRYIHISYVIHISSIDARKTRRAKAIPLGESFNVLTFAYGQVTTLFKRPTCRSCENWNRELEQRDRVR